MFESLNTITTISLADIPLFLICAAVYFVYRAVLSRFILPQFTKILPVSKDKHNRFVPRLFDAIHYVFSGIIGVLADLQRPYAHCFIFARDCFKFLQQNPNGFECTIFEKIYYILFTSYYIVDIFYVNTASEPIIIITHHIVCLSMIFSCIVLTSPVVGLSIMLLHDAVDIPLYVAKIFLYCNKHLPKDILFVVFALACTWFRIINFPIIIKHCLTVACGTPTYPLLYRGTCVLLCIMYALHIKWEYQIIRVAIGPLTGKAVHDSRSD